MTLGEKIRNRRKYLRLSGKEVAEAAKIGRSTYYTYEGGGVIDIPVETLKRLAEVLEVDMDFFKETDAPRDSFTPIEVSSVKDKRKRTIMIPSQWVADGKSYVGVIVDDDSFAPYILRGTVLVIRPVEDFVPGRVVVVGTGEGERRRLHIGRGFPAEGGDIRLIPLNVDGLPYVIESGKIEFTGLLIETRRLWIET